MTNELLDAARNNSDDSSEERYRKLKEEQAGTDMNKAEKRYEELKEKAKQDFIRQQVEDEEEESEEDKGSSGEDNFVTY